MRIIRMGDLVTEKFRNTDLEGIALALEKFGDKILPFFVVAKEDGLTWEDEMKIAKEYRPLSQNGKCFLYSPGEFPRVIKSTQDLLHALREKKGDTVVQRFLEVKRSGTAEGLPGDGLRVTGREGIPFPGAQVDVMDIFPDGHFEGGENDIITDDDVSLLKEAFAGKLDLLRLHWVINGGLHIIWADLIERAEEAETVERKEEKTRKEEEETGEKIPAGPPPVSLPPITATSVYLELDEKPFIIEERNQISGLVISIKMLKDAEMQETLENQHILFARMAFKDDEDSSLLEEETRRDLVEQASIVREVMKERGKLSLILPPVRTSDELRIVYSLMEEAGLYRSSRLKIFGQIAYPCNLMMEAEFQRYFDGVFVDLSRFTPLFSGYVGRHSPDIGIGPLLKAVDAINTDFGGEKEIIYSIRDMYSRELVEKLVRKGVNSISVDPEHLEKTVLAVARMEQRLLLRGLTAGKGTN